MEPISLVLAALLAGAAAGGQETASTAVKDAYDGLKNALARRVAARSGDEKAGEQAVADMEQKARAAIEPMATELRKAGADQDRALLAEVQKVLDALPGAAQQVDVSGSQNVQVGPGNSMSGLFYFNSDR